MKQCRKEFGVGWGGVDIGILPAYSKQATVVSPLFNVCFCLFGKCATHNRLGRQTSHLIPVAVTHASKVVCAASAQLSTAIIISLKSALRGIMVLTLLISSAVALSVRAMFFLKRDAVNAIFFSAVSVFRRFIRKKACCWLLSCVCSDVSKQ